MTTIKSATIQHSEDGTQCTVSINGGNGFVAPSQTGAIYLALEDAGIIPSQENIQKVIDVVRDFDGKCPTTNIARTAKPKRAKERVKGINSKLQATWVGKFFTETGNEIFECVSVIPPSDWQFTMRVLTDQNQETVLNLADFKKLTLIEVKPKKLKG